MERRVVINNPPGYIICDSTISVDYWPRSQNVKITHHFLTHAHSDHTKGLDAKWCHGIIYCTKVTQKLIIDLLNVSEEYTEVLDIGRSYQFRINEENSFQVELIDAKHCPGSVMFLFNGYFGTILSTGDFRYDPAMFVDSPLTPFLTNENSQVIDICYLDNTYCSKQYESIPTRENALLELISYIDFNLKSGKKFILKYKKLGKETLLIELSKRFNCKILVSKEKFIRLTKILELDEKYFTYVYNSSIFIEVEDVDKKYSSVLANKFSISELCFIEPTALYLNKNAYESTRQQKSKINTCFIPYTDHSSYSELLEFIKNLKPKHVVATVKELEDNTHNLHVINDMKCFDKYLTQQPLVDGLNHYRLILRTTPLVPSSERLKSTESKKLKYDHVRARPLKRKREMPKAIQYDTLSPMKPQQSANTSEIVVQLNEDVDLSSKETSNKGGLKKLKNIETHENQRKTLIVSDSAEVKITKVHEAKSTSRFDEEEILSLNDLESSNNDFNPILFDCSIDADRSLVLNGKYLTNMEDNSDKESFVSAQTNNVDCNVNQIEEDKRVTQDFIKRILSTSDRKKSDEELDQFIKKLIAM